MRSANSPKVETFDLAEQARRTHEECIREIQDLPCSSMRIIADVQLVDGIATPIAHRLGRKPAWICTSNVRGATTTGRIVESRTGSQDRTKVVVLTATGHGATVTVDVAIL